MKFTKGKLQSFTKLCDMCALVFESKSGSRKRCPACCKCVNCGIQLPNASHKFCSRNCASKWLYYHSEKVKKILDSGALVAHKTAAARMSKRFKGKPRYDMRGCNNPNWCGGRALNRKQRHTEMQRIEYKTWRNNVFQRDDYTCKLCDIRGSKLEAHHIERWDLTPKLRYAVFNGITLCVSCHNLIRNKEKEYQKLFEKVIKKGIL